MLYEVTQYVLYLQYLAKCSVRRRVQFVRSEASQIHAHLSSSNPSTAGDLSASTSVSEMY